MALRFDRSEIGKTVITPEGFLRTDAVVSRVGVFRYRNADGSTRKELRHPDHVFKTDSLATLKLIPITLLHPAAGRVDAANAKELQVGTTGEAVTPEGQMLRSTLVITRADAVAAVKAGTQELSLGYAVVLKREDGVWNGEVYDHVQTEIKYNHLAIVPAGRAGRDARIVLDAEDAFQDSTHHQGVNMMKVNLDGIEYDAAPEVAKALERANAKVVTLDAKVASVTAEKSSIQAKLDTAEAKLATELKRDHAAEIKAKVDARTKLVADVTPHLDAETVAKLPSMSDADIKVAVIKAKFPDAKLDGKDEAYLGARFDCALEIKTDAMATQRAAVGTTGVSTNLDAAKACSDYAKNLSQAWRASPAK